MKAHHKMYSNNSTNVRNCTFQQQVKQLSISAIGLLFPQITKSVIKQFFFKPVRKKITRKEQQWLERASNFQIKVHGKTIQCWKWGQGPVILAVHGWNGIGVNLYPLFSPLLQQGYSVVTFDAPAHGSSEGEQTNYFEITDTVRAVIKAIGKEALVGIIAHSLGGAAVINCLSKENISTKIALIAPALKLKELLFNTFKKNGVPRRLYKSIITEIEEEYGYSIEQDNPYRLLNDMDEEVLIAHDQGDKMVPFADAKNISCQKSNILLHTSKGLGHKHIIKAKSTADALLDYWNQSVSFDKQLPLIA